MPTVILFIPLSPIFDYKLILELQYILCYNSIDTVIVINSYIRTMHRNDVKVPVFNNRDVGTGIICFQFTGIWKCQP